MADQASLPARASKSLEGEYVRLHRVVRILQLIQGQDGWSAADLARECEVVKRTIHRDLQLLQAAGIPLFYDEESKFYRIRRDFFMKPVELTLDEALAVIALGEHIGKKSQIPFMQSAARAVAKIKAQLPGKIQRELDGVDRHMVIRLGQVSPGEGTQDVYAKVLAAQAKRCCLRCVYESGEKGFTEPFIFKPYTLLFERRAWYVIGHHGGHDAVRCLKLSRFTLVQETDHPFVVPSSFSLKKHLGNAWRMIRGEEAHSIKLRFGAKFAENIADTHWHDTQKIDWNPDGTITFRCKVDGLEEIVWWVMSMGPNCQVIEPKELRDRVKQLAKETLAVYRD